MKTRLLTAAVGIPVALAVLIASAFWPAVLCATLLVLCMIGIQEALHTVAGKEERLLAAPCFVYGALVMGAPLVGDLTRMCGLLMAGSVLFLFVMFAILLKKHAVLRVDVLCTCMILTMFVAFPFMSLEMLYLSVMKNPDGSPSYAGGILLVTYCLLLSWVADGGAYFVGRALGRHKLAPVISPKKTIEGSVGGLVCSMVISLGAAYLYADGLGYAPGRVSYGRLALITLLCILMSMFGDLSFSAVKRQYGIKDYGNLLPGHGGVLDRFDSVLFVAPSFFLLHLVLPVIR